MNLKHDDGNIERFECNAVCHVTRISPDRKSVCQ